MTNDDRQHIADKREPLEGWRWVQLQDAFTFTRKPRDLQISAYTQVPFVPMEMIPIGSVYFAQYVLKSQDELTSGTYFEPGDVLLAKITPSFENGKQGIIEHLPTPFGIATTEVIPLQGIPELSDNLFLFYYLLRHSIRVELAGKMEGTTGRQRLNKSALESLEIPLPPLPEQRAIAHALRTVQAAREARRREAVLERERKAALMQRLFTQGTQGEPTKTTEIGEAPVSWEVVPFSTIAETQYGYQTSIPSEPPPNGCKIISTAEIKNAGFLDLSKIRTVDIPERFISQYAVHKDDILFNWRNAQEHVGKTALVEFESEEPLIFASFILRITSGRNVNHQYLHFLLSYFRQEGVFFRLSRRAVNQANFNANELGALLIPLAPQAEQLEIIEVLRACDEQISALEREAAAHDELFRALLEELMTGRLRAMELIDSL